MLPICAMLALSCTLAVAQSNESKDRPSKPAESQKQSVTPTQVKRVESADKLKAAQPENSGNSKVSQENIQRGIEEIERVMKENDGKEGFRKEDYQKRLEHLRSLLEDNK
jgi:hypothetical protein